MLMFYKKVIGSLFLGSSLVAGGCATTAPAASAELAPSTQAVMCDKCQVTWVKVPTNDGKGRLVGYSAREKMVCPDCKDAVTNFFETGKFEHTCKTCGDSMKLCDMH